MSFFSRRGGPFLLVPARSLGGFVRCMYWSRVARKGLSGGESNCLVSESDPQLLPYPPPSIQSCLRPQAMVASSTARREESRQRWIRLGSRTGSKVGIGRSAVGGALEPGRRHAADARQRDAGGTSEQRAARLHSGGSSNSTGWRTSTRWPPARRWLPICSMQPGLPVTTKSGFAARMRSILRAPIAPARSGCSRL